MKDPMSKKKGNAETRQDRHIAHMKGDDTMKVNTCLRGPDRPSISTTITRMSNKKCK